MSDDLSMVTEILNEVMTRAEKALKNFRWGVEASVPLDDEHRLGFRRHKGQWKFCLLTVEPGATYPWELLSTQPRRYRVLAARKIPELHEALKLAAADEESDIRQVIEDLEAYCVGLERPR